MSKSSSKTLNHVKQCYKCQETLPLDAFNKNASRKDGLATWCRECWKVYYKTHYYQQGKEKERLLRRNKKQQQEVRTFVTEAKSVPCMDCGVQYPSWVMEFDHRGDDPKLFNVAKGVYSQSMKAVRAEIAKCDVVCANCHRQRTHDRYSGIG